MGIKVHRHPDASSFLRRAEAWLLRSEVENNIILGLCGPFGPAASDPPPDLYLATVEEAGDVVACAARTPPYNPIITRGDQRALRCLVDDLLDRYGGLPAVTGPEPEVGHFAQLWSERTGVATRRGVQQRLFENRQVQLLPRRPAGQLRLAIEADLSVIAEWLPAFYGETLPGDPRLSPQAEAQRRVSQGRMFVWEDGQPVSMAGWTACTRSNVRVSLVYTPPEFRQRGYASACVADLTQRLLSQGCSYCCLYTDLANPTSNSIYQKIGYRPVCDNSDYILAGPASA